MDNDEIKYCQHLLLFISHGFHRVDENGCTFAQSVRLHEGFYHSDEKPMKTKLLLNGTAGGLHGSDLSRWNLFRPLNHFVATYRLVKCQELFSGPSHSTMRLV